MIGRKYSKSVILRLEALEAKNPGSLIFEVVKDGEAKRVTFRELMEMTGRSHCSLFTVNNYGQAHMRTLGDHHQTKS